MRFFVKNNSKSIVTFLSGRVTLQPAGSAGSEVPLPSFVREHPDIEMFLARGTITVLGEKEFIEETMRTQVIAPTTTAPKESEIITPGEMGHPALVPEDGDVDTKDTSVETKDTSVETKNTSVETKNTSVETKNTSVESQFKENSTEFSPISLPEFEALSVSSRRDYVREHNLQSDISLKSSYTLNEGYAAYIQNRE